MSALADGIGRVLAVVVRGVLRFRRLTVALSLVAAALSAYYAAGHLGVNTDTANMISPTLPWRRDFIEFRDAFPVRDKNLLIVVDAPSADRADVFAKKLVAELRKQPELFHSILLQGEGEFFERNGFLYLDTQQLEQLSDRLAAAQPLLGLLHDRFDGTAVVDVAGRTLTGDDARAADAAIAPFYAALAGTLDSAVAGTSVPLDWSRLVEGGAAPSTRKLVILQPELDYTRILPATAAIAAARAIVERLNADTADPVRVRFTGTVAMENEELKSVTDGMEIGGVVTLLMVAFVLYAALRSWRLLGMSVLALVVGLSLTAGFAAAVVGHLNLLSVAFVVLNFGLGSDYIIHILLRYKELVGRGATIESALIETTSGVGASLVLCAVTTAAGFYSFIPTLFQGVSELGLIAGTGVFFSLIVSVTFVPALVGLFPPGVLHHEGRTWIDTRPFVFLNKRPRLVLAGTAVVALAAFIALPRVTFDSNPIHLRDPETESVKTLLELSADGEAPLMNLAAMAPDHATALKWAAALRELPVVRSVVTLESLVPRDQDQKAAVIEDMGLIMGPGFADVDRKPADPQALEGALERLADSSTESTTAGSLHAAVTAFLARLQMAAPADRTRALRGLDEALTGDLPDELRRLAAALKAKPFGRDALPEVLADRWLASRGRELIEIVPAEDVSDNAAARRFVDGVRAVVPHATGLPVVYQEASTTVVQAFERALLYAFVMVTAIIFLVLRDVKDTLLVILPILLSSAVTAGFTVLIDLPFNYANIIALPLLVGIGVDNGIHVVHRMRTEDATQLFDTSTMRAVLASGLTTVASFGNLAFSSHVGTASMGILLALGLAASMSATLIVLPAWLKLFGRAAHFTA